MTKREFISKIAERAGVTKGVAYDVLEAMKEVVLETLKKGDKITIQRFGTFETKTLKPRTTRLHGREFNVPEMEIPVFRFSKKLRNEFRKFW